MKHATYDYIIVGGGAAGCALAARLTENAELNVLLLEEGGRNRNPFIRVPMAVTKTLYNRKYCTTYYCAEEPQSKGRTFEVPRGRGLGGSSVINGMIYVRGHPSDYDEWAELGCEGWAFKDLLPAFKRVESYAPGDPAVRGHNGPLHVRRFQSDPLAATFIDAVQGAGHPFVEDYNGLDQEGATWTQHNIYPDRRGRCSARAAYLVPAMARPNLTVCTNAPVLRVALDGTTATGVELLHRGRVERVQAHSEVVLCAGAIRTPPLLMHSGIGPAAELARHGIDVTADLPGVGQGLQDHFGAFVQHACKKPVTYFNHLGPVGAIKSVVQYLATGLGPLSHYPTQAMAFLKTEEHLSKPDLQLLFAPFTRPRAGTSVGAGAMSGHGYCINWCQLRPESQGSIVLASSDPLAAPRICHNYLVDERDRAFHRRTVRLVREIHAQSAFTEFRDRELDPGVDCRSDAEIDDYMRATGHTHMHPVGTASMGGGPMAVVAPDLRVHGIERLRIADASIMPTLVGANTHAPSLMIGERAAELLR